jgi:hypothetical protein
MVMVLRKEPGGMKDWIKRWGPAVLVMAIIFIASSTPGKDIPSFDSFDLFAKKGGHMIGYALLAAAFFHALSTRKGFKRSYFIIAAFLAITYAASDEWHQTFTIGRSPSIYDVCIDTAGASIGLILVYLLYSRRKKHASGITIQSQE